MWCFISLNATANVWMLENPVVFSPVSLLHICWSLFLWMPPIFCHRRVCVERQSQIWLFCLQSCSCSKTHIHTCKPGKENKSKRGKHTGSECVWMSQLRFASGLDNNSRLFSYANFSNIQFLLCCFQPCSLILALPVVSASFKSIIFTPELKSSFKGFVTLLVINRISALLFVSLVMEEDDLCTLPTHYLLNC